MRRIWMGNPRLRRARWASLASAVMCLTMAAAGVGLAQLSWSGGASNATLASDPSDDPEFTITISQSTEFPTEEEDPPWDDPLPTEPDETLDPLPTETETTEDPGGGGDPEPDSGCDDDTLPISVYPHNIKSPPGTSAPYLKVIPHIKWCWNNGALTDIFKTKQTEKNAINDPDGRLETSFVNGDGAPTVDSPAAPTKGFFTTQVRILLDDPVDNEQAECSVTIKREYLPYGGNGNALIKDSTTCRKIGNV